MEVDIQYMISYLENKLTPEERKAFEELLGSSTELRQEFKEIRFLWTTTGEQKLRKQINTKRNWDELSRRIRFDKYKNKLWHFSRTAAAILFIPVLIATVIFYNGIKENKEIPVGQVEISSAYGLISKVKLPDGSNVWLNSGSVLSYPQKFSSGKRQVSLSGEAYFEVNADKSNRFEVLVNDSLIVSAYGTEFNICAYKNDTEIEATLASGNIEVSVINQVNAIRVLPGQQAIFNKKNAGLEVAEADVYVKTSWKDGKMVFRRANMAEITQRLSRRFNVDVQLVGRELHDYEYFATFTIETLDDILHLLEKSAPIKCEIIEPQQSEDYSYSRRTVIIKHTD